MSDFLPVPDSSGFDDEEDVEDSSARIRQFRDSFERVTGPDDLMCYKLNPETKLYRADTERLQNGVNPGIATDYLPVFGPVFFGFAESSVDQYGIVAEYEVLQPIHSIALDDPDTLNKLHDDCVIEDIKKILRENYGAYGPPNQERTVRKSVKPNDFKLINYLINTYGIGGTVFLASVFSEGGSFHSEIALPQPQIKSDFLRINGIVTDPTKIPGKIAEYKIRVNAPAKLQAKKSHPFVSKKKSVKKEKKTRTKLFDDSDNEDTSSSGTILNFGDDTEGGSLRKSSKKTKIKKTKRAKKSQRRRR